MLTDCGTQHTYFFLEKYINYRTIISNIMETITISKQEYVELKKKAEVDEELLVSLVKGLEDIRNGRVSQWKKRVIN